MPNLEEEQSEEKQLSPYLDSVKAFLLEAPLYHEFDLSIKDEEKKIKEFLSYNRTIDAHCLWCEKEGVFNAYDYLTDYVSTPSWVKRNDGLISIEYRCTRDARHAYHIYYFKVGTFITKVGQFPSSADFQIPQVENYRKILGEEQYKELARGIGLSSHGVGIGSFVYLRRVFENLINEARTKAETELTDFNSDEYMRLRMDEKIMLVKDYLPEFLVENRKLYSILTLGMYFLRGMVGVVYLVKRK